MLTRRRLIAATLQPGVHRLLRARIDRWPIDFACSRHLRCCQTLFVIGALTQQRFGIELAFPGILNDPVLHAIERI